MDQRDALSHGLDFCLPDRGGEGMDLAIDVGLCDVVEVNQCEMAHTTTGQCLGGPGAYSPQAHHHHV